MKFSEHYERFRKELPDRERITLEMCERAVAVPVETEAQTQDRVAYWACMAEEDRYLKVVVELEEGIVTAHFDRVFKRKMDRRQRG